MVPADADGEVHIKPRDLNPSPVGAIEWALKRGLGLKPQGEQSITNTPWPMLMRLGIANFPTQACCSPRDTEPHDTEPHDYLPVDAIT